VSPWCAVKDEETDPVMTMSGTMGEFVLTPVPGFQLVTENLQVDMYAFVDASRGRTVQVHPIKPTLKAPGTNPLKL